MKILLAEDEPRAAKLLRRGFTEEGFAVDAVAEGNGADEMVAVNAYGAIVLNVTIPGVDGFTLCERWRKRGVATPIIFVGACKDVADRVRGLNLGGDDYLVKPFAFSELVARVRALLRRNRASPTPGVFRIGELTIDTMRRDVTCEGTRIRFTPREYAVLEHLARNAGSVVTRTALWDSVWEDDTAPDSNVVDVYIGYLRNKLGRYGRQIETVRGVGYMLDRRLRPRDI